MFERPAVFARPHLAARLVLALLAFAIGLLGGASTALAHTDFESSDPADQSTVDGPLSEIVIDFTNPAVLSGDGIQVLGPDGAIVAPVAIDTTDGTSFIARFDPPLGDGTYGVRWEVQAGDAHPIDGSFRFDVVNATPAAPPATTTSTTTTVVPAASDAAAAPPATTVPPAATGIELDEFLADDGDGGDNGVMAGRIGRLITFTGTILGVGLLAALAVFLRGSRDELRTIVGWVRLAGVAVTAGGLVELMALHSNNTDGVTTLLDTKPGIAAALKIVAGIVVWVGFRPGAGEINIPARSVSAATLTDAATSPLASSEFAARWVPGPTASVGLAGYAAVLVSFWFDGHTVSKGSWPLHALVNLVHLGAASVWVGGVVAMATVAWKRRHRGDDTGIASMVVRFSGLASVSLVAVTVAGLAMTYLIVDDLGDLTGTDWGRVLLVKTAVVAVAAGLGAVNHFRLRPALEARPDDPETLRELRRSLAVEAVVFLVVIAVSAVLVASAT